MTLHCNRARLQHAADNGRGRITVADLRALVKADDFSSWEANGNAR